MALHDNSKPTSALVVPSLFTGQRKFGDLRYMDNGDFDRVYSEVFAVVHDAVKKQGFWAAGAFLLQVNNSGKVGLAFPANFAPLFKEKGALGKEIAAEYINHMLKFDACDFVVMVSEAFRSPANDGEPRPSQHPEREEVLMFNVMSKNMQAISICQLSRNSVTDALKIEEKAELTFVNDSTGIAKGLFIREAKVSPDRMKMH